MLRFFRNRTTPTLYVKTFLCFVIAFVLVFLCISFFNRPNPPKHKHHSYDNHHILQQELNEALSGQDFNVISQYINEYPNEPISEAYVLTRTELLNPQIAYRYGIILEEGMRYQLLQGHSFRTGKINNLKKQSSLNFLQLDFLFKKADRETLESENKTKSKKKWEFPHVRVFSFDEFCTLNDFLTYVYYWSYQKKVYNHTCRHPRNSSSTIVPIAKTPYVIVIRHPHVPPLPRPVMPIILSTVFSFLILFITVFILIFPLIKSVTRVRNTCQKVCEGDFTARCNAPRKDIMSDLANNVDEMTSAIERHLTQQKSLLQAVSHELRTPLSRIRFNIEMLDINENDEKSIARLDSIDEDLSEIDNLIRELSYFNYVDSGNGCQMVETVSVKELIETTMRQRSHDLVNFNVQVSGLSDELMIDADPTAFKRVIGNLLSNASRYAKTQIRVVIQLLKDESVDISVEDDGQGIPEDKREHIFEPFYCLDASRSKASTGFGLGLAIAHRIMKLHHGSIAVESSELGGARMVTIWPIHSDHHA